MRTKFFNRRAFLGGALGAAATLAAKSSVALPPLSSPLPFQEPQLPRSRPLSPADFRRFLAGPIQSQPTPIAENHEVDYDGIRNVVKRGKQYGVRIFELTAGNSQYFSLSYEEIKKVTRTLVEAVEGHGLVIAATGGWWTDRAADYVRYAESVGADAVQILMPEPHGDEDGLVRHFESIARATKLPLVLHGVYSESLLKKLMTIESIVAMKEDSALDYYIDRIIQFGGRLEIFSGGAENRYLVGYPYGAKAFFSTYTSFAPDISMKFWRAIQQGDIKRAAEITTHYDYPFIKRFTVPFWHATLEYFGVAKRFVRPPQAAFTDEQMKDVQRFFDGQGLKPAQYLS